MNTSIDDVKLEDADSSGSEASKVTSLDYEYRIPNYEYNLNNSIEALIQTFVIRAIKLSKKSSRRASLYKGLDVTGSIILLLLAAGITFVSLGNRITEPNAQYVSGILGVIVGLIEGAKRIFNFSRRGNLFEQVSNKSFYLSQRARQLKTAGLSEERIICKLNDYYLKLSNLDISSYDLNATTLYSSGSKSRSSGNRSYQSNGVPLRGIGSIPSLNLGGPTITNRGTINVPNTPRE